MHHITLGRKPQRVRNINCPKVCHFLQNSIVLKLFARVGQRPLLINKRIKTGAGLNTKVTKILATAARFKLLLIFVGTGGQKSPPDNTAENICKTRQAHFRATWQELAAAIQERFRNNDAFIRMLKGELAQNRRAPAWRTGGTEIVTGSKFIFLTRTQTSTIFLSQ